MSDNLSSWPVLQLAAEAAEHDPDTPALIPVPGHLARPLLVMLDQLFNLAPAGQLARGIELLLVGLADAESSAVLAGLKDVAAGAECLTRTPAEVAVEVAEEVDVRQSSRPYLRLLRSGWDSAPFIEAGEPDSLEIGADPGGAA